MKYVAKKKAVIVLEDGKVFYGKAAGKIGTTTGEICFNTGMTGYQEIFTDPSYYKQIVVMTASHVGNYGVAIEEVESEGMKIAGMVCKSFSPYYSRPGGNSSLQEYFVDQDMVSISDVDTRALVRYIRDKGAMNAIISSDELDIGVLKEQLKKEPSMDGLELASKVSCSEPYFFGDEHSDKKVAVLDFFDGDEQKANIIITQKPAEEVTELQTPDYWQFMRLNFTWKEAGTIEETPLYKWTLPSLLNAMDYSSGCVEMLTYTLGFKEPLLSVMDNAGASFQSMVDFPVNPEFYTFKKGFSTLPNKLVSEIGEDKIFLSTNVDKIDTISNSEYKYSLDLSIAPEHQRAFPFEGAIKKTIKAKQIIMAIGRNAMEKLFHASPSLNNQLNSNQFRKNLPTVTNQKLLKINLYFEKDWWNEELKGKLYGPNLTDLQCNTVYPFYAVDAHPNDKTPAALTIYCDWDNADYWNALQIVGKKFSSELQEDHNNDLPQVLYPASEAVLKEASKQIALLFGVPTIPKPKLTSFRLWDGQSDFGYAVHEWRLGANDKDVIEQMISPFENIYTCNEAWSDMQCWVNGSLRSADLVLNRHFGIESLVNVTVKE